MANKTKFCDYCGKPLKKVYRGNYGKKKYCDYNCRMQWWNDYKKYMMSLAKAVIMETDKYKHEKEVGK